MIQMYITDSLYLNGEEAGKDRWKIHLSNGQDVVAERHMFNRESIPESCIWTLDNELHISNRNSDLETLLEYITEQLTGNHIVFRSKGSLPHIDQVDELKAAKNGHKVVYAFPKEANLPAVDGEPMVDGNKMFRLSNGKTFMAGVQARSGANWYEVDGQLFSRIDYAARYTRKHIIELLTGKRVLFHKKFTVPCICGIDGVACRSKGACNTNLCMSCPVGEKFFADKDGLDIIYAV